MNTNNHNNYREEITVPTNINDSLPLYERAYDNAYHDYIVLRTNETSSQLESIVGADHLLNIGKAYAIVYTQDTSQETYRAISQFAQINEPLPYTLMDIGTMDAAGITQMQLHPFVPLTGRGILIGIIDTGIDFTHEVFRNADGTTRIACIWDQSLPGEAQNDHYAPFGTVFTREQINEALQSEDPYSIVPHRDENGHGTFISGLAAGGRGSNFTGAAPEAELVVVKLKEAKQYLKDFHLIFNNSVPVYQENDIMTAVDYLNNKAIELQKPISMCISLGTNEGSHDNFGHLSRISSDIGLFRGRTICAAAGNEGNTAHHAVAQIPSENATASIELRVGASESGFPVNIWAKAPDLYAVSLTSPTGEIIEKVPFSATLPQTYNFALERTSIVVDYENYSNLNGNQHISVKFISPTPGIWLITLHGERVLYGECDLWLPQTGLLDPSTIFINISPYTTVTDPANNERLIVAGAYNSIDESAYINSGRGFTKLGDIAPTLLAPGVNVSGPLPGGEFGVKSGTSIAAAICTGACALILDWGINRQGNTAINTLSARSMLISGAIRQSGISYPNQQSGYGQLNLYNSFRELKTITPHD